MKTIITQVAEKVVEDILINIYENGISDIGETAESLMSVLKEGTLELLSAAVSEVDQAVLSAKKERKIDGITVKQRNVPRTVVTSLGNLTYERTYFKLTDGTMAYLRQHRTKNALRLSTAYACSFSVILHKTHLITVRLTALVLHNLTKKLTAHLRHYLCAVLP